jgi:hypothetical protein
VNRGASAGKAPAKREGESGFTAKPCNLRCYFFGFAGVAGVLVVVWMPSSTDRDPPVR